jgi:hypothetical protein
VAEPSNRIEVIEAWPDHPVVATQPEPSAGGPDRAGRSSWSDGSRTRAAGSVLPQPEVPATVAAAQGAKSIQQDSRSPSVSSEAATAEAPVYATAEVASSGLDVSATYDQQAQSAEHGREESDHPLSAPADETGFASLETRVDGHSAPDTQNPQDAPAASSGTDIVENSLASADPFSGHDTPSDHSTEHSSP